MSQQMWFLFLFILVAYEFGHLCQLLNSYSSVAAVPLSTSPL